MGQGGCPHPLPLLQNANRPDALPVGLGRRMNIHLFGGTALLGQRFSGLVIPERLVVVGEKLFSPKFRRSSIRAGQLIHSGELIELIRVFHSSSVGTSACMPPFWGKGRRDSARGSSTPGSRPACEQPVNPYYSYPIRRLRAA